MELQDLLKKVSTIDGIDDETKTSVTALLGGDLDKILDGRAKGAREKAQRDYDTKVEELNGKIKDLSDALEAAKTGDLSDKEKIEKQIKDMAAQVETLTKANAALTEEKESLTNEKSTLERNHKVDALFGNLRFIEGANVAGMRTLYGDAMKEVDLTKEDAVKTATESFIEANKFAVAADGIGGAGSGGNKGGGSPPPPGGGRDPAKLTDEEYLSDLNKGRKLR